MANVKVFDINLEEISFGQKNLGTQIYDYLDRPASPNQNDLWWFAPQRMLMIYQGVAWIPVG